MASADEYAAWIVKNKALKGSPEFATVASAYEEAKKMDSPPPAGGGAPMNTLRGFNEFLEPFAGVSYDTAAHVAKILLGAASGPERAPPDFQTYNEKFVGPPPQTPAEHVARKAGRMGGEALSYAAMLTGGGGLLAKAPAAAKFASGTARRIIGGLLENMAAKPAAELGMNLVAGTTAGAAGELAGQMGGGSTARSAAELIGGLLAPVAITAGKAAAYLPAGLALRYGKYALPMIKRGEIPLPWFTETAGKDRAVKRIGELTIDRKQALEQLDAETLSDLTPAQRTGDPGLLSLERAAMGEDARLAEAFGEQSARNKADLQDEVAKMGGGGKASALLDPLRARRDALTDRIETQRVEKKAAIQDRRESATEALNAAHEDRLIELEGIADDAAQAYDDAAAKIVPGQTADQASVEYRRIFDAAEERASKLEDAAWASVKVSKRRPLTRTISAFIKERGRLAKALKGDMPPAAAEFLDPKSEKFLGVANTIKEIHGLRSKLLSFARLNAQPGKEDSRRLAYVLSEKLLDDLGDGGKAVDPSLQNALDLSRLTNERFRRGAGGEILQKKRTGERAVPDVSTLDAAIGAGGSDALAGVKESLLAAPEGEGAVRSYLLNLFQKKAVSGGAVNPAAGANFLRDNATLLDMPEFQGIAGDIRNAVAARSAAKLTAQTTKTQLRESKAQTGKDIRAVEREAALAEKAADTRAKVRTSEITSPEISYTAKFLGADPHRLADTVFSGAERRPDMFARVIVQAARKDSTGAAMAGLKTAATDYLLRKAGVGGIDDNGVAILSGRPLKKLINENRAKGVLGQWFNPEEMLRLNRIADEMIIVEASQTGKSAAGGVSTDMPSTILKFVVSKLGAEIGAKTSTATLGGSLQGANLTAGAFRNWIDKMTRDTAKEWIIKAVKDKEVMREMLTKAGDVGVKKQRFKWTPHLPIWPLATIDSEKEQQ